MATVCTTLPDAMEALLRARARDRGLPLESLVQEALMAFLAPEPFAREGDAQAAVEAHEDEVLGDGPWDR
jgi:hypothetical protein